MKSFTKLMQYKIQAIALTCVLGAVVGCKPSTHAVAEAGAEHSGHNDATANFGEAYNRLVTHKTNIQAAFEKSDPESAHDDLHQIGHAIESLAAVARKSGITDADLLSVEVAAKSLFEVYGRLDEMLHGGDDVAYKDVAGEIDSAISALEKFAPK